MADEQRTYIVPLRREWLKVPVYKRTRKAVKTLRAFIAKHMKNENVKIGKHLNLKLWSSGNRNPPHKIEVTAYRKEDKDKGSYVIVELPGIKIEEKKKEEGKENLLGKLKRKGGKGQEEQAKEKADAEKADASKHAEKHEGKEQKEKKEQKSSEQKSENKGRANTEANAEGVKPSADSTEILEKESKVSESEASKKKQMPRPKKEEGFAKHEGIYRRDDKNPKSKKEKSKKAEK